MFMPPKRSICSRRAVSYAKVAQPKAARSGRSFQIKPQGQAYSAFSSGHRAGHPVRAPLRRRPTSPIGGRGGARADVEPEPAAAPTGPARTRETASTATAARSPRTRMRPHRAGWTRPSRKRQSGRPLRCAPLRAGRHPGDPVRLRICRTAAPCADGADSRGGCYLFAPSPLRLNTQAIRVAPVLDRATLPACA